MAGCGDRVTDIEHFQRAQEYQTQQNLPASIIELKNTLQKNPENREARLLLGQIYVETGDGASAEKELQRAGELGAERATWLTPLARAYLLQGQNPKMLELTALDSDPAATQATLLALRGLAEMALGRPDAARTA